MLRELAMIHGSLPIAYFCYLFTICADNQANSLKSASSVITVYASPYPTPFDTECLFLEMNIKIFGLYSG